MITPGSWEIFNTDIGIGVINTSGKISDIAWVELKYKGLYSTSRSGEECLANAKAIAAVPDMLQIMGELAIWVQSSLDCERHPWDGDQYAAAKYAVDEANAIIEGLK